METSGGNKKCPFCAEEIKEAAVKCKFCKAWLDESVRPKPPLPAARRPDVSRYALVVRRYLPKLLLLLGCGCLLAFSLLKFRLLGDPAFHGATLAKETAMALGPYLLLVFVAARVMKRRRPLFVIGALLLAMGGLVYISYERAVKHLALYRQDLEVVIASLDLVYQDTIGNSDPRAASRWFHLQKACKDWEEFQKRQQIYLKLKSSQETLAVVNEYVAANAKLRQDVEAKSVAPAQPEPTASPPKISKASFAEYKKLVRAGEAQIKAAKNEAKKAEVFAKQQVQKLREAEKRLANAQARREAAYHGKQPSIPEGGSAGSHDYYYAGSISTWEAEEARREALSRAVAARENALERARDDADQAVSEAEEHLQIVRRNAEEAQSLAKSAIEIVVAAKSEAAETARNFIEEVEQKAKEEQARAAQAEREQKEKEWYDGFVASQEEYWKRAAVRLEAARQALKQEQVNTVWRVDLTP